MMYWTAYRDRGGYIVISPYRGEANQQHMRLRIKRLIGTYQAPDIQAARKIALNLEGVGLPL